MGGAAVIPRGEFKPACTALVPELDTPFVSGACALQRAGIGGGNIGIQLLGLLNAGLGTEPGIFAKAEPLLNARLGLPIP